MEIENSLGQIRKIPVDYEYDVDTMGNYVERVKENSKYLSIKQLD